MVTVDDRRWRLDYPQTPKRFGKIKEIESFDAGFFGVHQPQQFGVTGNMRNIVAHRISYFLKVKGPSMVVDTACSTSIPAIEAAFQAIRNGHCDNAIICGGNLFAFPKVMAAFAMLVSICSFFFLVSKKKIFTG